MVAYNFQRCFAHRIQDGWKRQTIRPIGRGRHAAVGERMQLYCGMRTRHCFKIIDDPLCTTVVPIIVEFTGDALPSFTLDGRALSIDECRQIAFCDGFTSLAQMSVFFWRVYTRFKGLSPPPDRYMQLDAILIRWDREDIWVDSAIERRLDMAGFPNADPT